MAVIVSTSILVMAAAGGLDNTLDGNGKLATDFNGNEDRAYDVLVQPDGKIVVSGIADGFLGNPAIARYNVNGSIDTTFGGGDGKVTLPGVVCLKALLARDNAGRIIVATCSFSPTTVSDLHVFRLTQSGDLDTTFDGDGRADLGTNLGDNFTFRDVTTDSSNRIIVVGGHSGGVIGGPGPVANWLIWRVNTNGSLDTGFDGDGRVQTDFGGNQNEYGVGVHVLPSGKLIVGGTASPGNTDFALALYTTNGSLDTSWGGGDGKVVTDLTTADVAIGMKVTPDGKFVIGGTSVGVNGPGAPTFLRYSADGNLDNTFDGDGSVQTYIVIDLKGFAIQFDGKIVTAGTIGASGNNDFVLVRLKANGSVDTSWGTSGSGQVVTDMNNNSNDMANAITIGTDRRIVAVGSTLNTAAGSTVNFVVARYLPTNRLYHAPFDFDGDARSDFGIFRPSNGQWWINRSATNITNVYTFGVAADRLTPHDFTGDGKADVAFWRPSTGEWFVLRSENFSFYAFPFGANGDVPVPGDYDADGKSDAAVFRPSSSTWYISQSGGAPTRIEQFGISTDQPVPADYDEDGKFDVAIFRPGPGEWWVNRSTAGLMALQFGQNGDKPVQGDHTGDGKADVAFFRPSTGEWYVVRSEDGSFYGFPFGASGDLPAPADYDGDGRIDPTVVRGTTWFIGRSNGGTSIFGYGVAGDRPITNAFVP